MDDDDAALGDDDMATGRASLSTSINYFSMPRLGSKAWQRDKSWSVDQSAVLCDECGARGVGERSDGAKGGQGEVYTPGPASPPSPPHLTHLDLQPGHTTFRQPCLSAPLDCTALTECGGIKFSSKEAVVHELRVCGVGWYASGISMYSLRLKTSISMQSISLRSLVRSSHLMRPSLLDASYCDQCISSTSPSPVDDRRLAPI
jgi:hypothetical protein